MKYGSTEAFVVQTAPEGAQVITDLETGASRAHRARTDEGPEAARYFGCSPTPCSIELPRKSQFNVLVTKQGYQPFTWAVTFKRNVKHANKTAREGTVPSVASGLASSSLIISAMNSAGPGAYLTTSAASVAATSVGVLPTAIGASAIVDTASGALMDLYPNPLQVKLVPEHSPQNTQELVQAFEKSRAMHTAEEKQARP